VTVEVRDSGPGMPPEVLNRLFTPFFTTKPVGLGTGLGLSICHRIVSALGGEISAQSVIGKGSTFKVVLPVGPPMPAAPPAPEAAAPAPRDSVRRGRILVIDDEPMMVKVIQRMLSQDHEVAGTVDAQQGLDWIAAGQRFDVILCDLMMPRVTGMDFHAELSSSAPDQAKRVIFLTGGAFTARMRTFLDEVDNLRLEKPFD
jgi:CheY-like chemotaxis protein